MTRSASPRPLALALATISLALLPACRIVGGSGNPDEKTIGLDTGGVDTIEVRSGLEVHAESVTGAASAGSGSTLTLE